MNLAQMFDEGPLVGERTLATRVYLARHGETVWNLERRFQGHGDSPLSERGQEQARRLGERLACEPLAAIYSSDLGRARQTAEVVAEHHDLPVQVDPRLREIDTGVWTGSHRSEIRQVPEWARIVDLYHNRPWEAHLPGGETVGDVQTRGLAFLREVAPRHAGQAIAVVAHHVVVETVVAEALGVPLEGLWLPQRGGNCFLSILEVETETLRPLLIYDGAHLDGLGSVDGTRRGPGGENAT